MSDNLKTSPNKKGTNKKGGDGNISIPTDVLQGRLTIILVLIGIAFAALFFKILMLQKNNAVEYNKKILSQFKYESKEIPYKRGDILDRNGTYIATSEKVYDLILDAKQINSNQDKYLEATVNLLSEFFGYSTDELRNVIAEKSDNYYVVYAKNISYEQKIQFEEKVEEFRKTQKESKEPKEIKGVWFEAKYKRMYPYGSTACNVIGFSGDESSKGYAGIEQYYNDTLTGISGREYGYLNDRSSLERIFKDPIDGNMVVSTIDLNIQKIVEKYINEWQNSTGSNMTAAIVMNPNNGEILAMATSRTFDLNNPRDLNPYYSQEQQDAMDDKAKGEALNNIWRNYTVSDTYEPGSPSKVFTVASAMEEGTINGNESYNCRGFEEIGGWKIRCANRNGHGDINVTEALMESCNVAMMDISRAEGGKKFYEYQKVFGFGLKTDIDLPGEADTSSLVHTAENAGATDLATNSFGQNYNTTMIQVAAAYSSVVNGGSYYKPHVAKQILNSKGAVIKNIDPELVRETVSAHTTIFINEALRRTVAEGTGGAAAVAGYDVGGKTGTAEKYPRGNGNYLVSFIGSVPAQSPEVVCYVLVDTPHVADQARSAYASSLFSKIMTEVLPYMNIYSNVDEGIDVSSFPSAEGITDSSTQTEAETKVYSREEVIPNDGENDLPGAPAGETQE
jgi:penicillin-binding protein